MLLSIILGLTAVSGFALYRAIRNAPEGWEDQSGFHAKPPAHVDAVGESSLREGSRVEEVDVPSSSVRIPRA